MDEWDTGRLTNGEQAVVAILRKALFRLPVKPYENTFVVNATASPTCRYIMLVCFYSVIIRGGPKNNRKLNVAGELEAVARCAARWRESIQYCSSPPRGVNLGWPLLLLCFFFKCLLGSSATFVMVDNKEQRVCVKFCFLLRK